MISAFTVVLRAVQAAFKRGLNTTFHQKDSPTPLRIARLDAGFIAGFCWLSGELIKAASRLDAVRDGLRLASESTGKVAGLATPHPMLPSLMKATHRLQGCAMSL